MIHAFITMSTIDYTWHSITNNQQHIVQDVQLLSWWAGLHPSTTALLIMLSNSVALFLSNYINTLQFLLANLKFSFYWKHDFFPSWDWWKYVNGLYLRYETFFITNSLSWTTSFPVLFLNTASKIFLSTYRAATCQHILQKTINALARSQILDKKILWKQ